MLSRRLIRIKVFKVLFSKIASGSDSLSGAEKELIASCEKTRDLYLFMLNLSVALTRTAQAKIEGGLRKFQPTEEEARPNRKFAENLFAQWLENDAEFMRACETGGLMWSEYGSFVKKLYESVVSKDYYKEYMSRGERSAREDFALFRKIYEQELEDNADLEEILEDTSLFWMDDLSYVLGIILKNMPAMLKKEGAVIPPVFQKEEDRAYAKKLLARSLVNYDEYTEIITGYIPNWDLERLVATDLALIVMGIAEAVNFETIPLKVTINEFVDISKYYSTPNSKVFVNGLLDRVLQKMYSDGEIVKTGRGLVGSAE